MKQKEYTAKGKKKINVNYFKCPTLHYSKSDKTDESNAVWDGGRM